MAVDESPIDFIRFTTDALSVIKKNSSARLRQIFRSYTSGDYISCEKFEYIVRDWIKSAQVSSDDIIMLIIVMLQIFL